MAMTMSAHVVNVQFKRKHQCTGQVPSSGLNPSFPISCNTMQLLVASACLFSTRLMRQFGLLNSERLSQTTNRVTHCVEVSKRRKKKLNESHVLKPRNRRHCY